MRVLVALISVSLFSVELGIDRFIKEESTQYKSKTIGLITNHTGLTSFGKPTATILQEAGLHVKAIFSPEHGFNATTNLPIFDLHTQTKRPTKEMLQGIDLLIYDIQDIGVRSYTYPSTLYLAMEEAAKNTIPLIVLDRPNPIGGEVIDGPLLEKKHRSFLGYLEIPYCHGMTIGELARFFNAEYAIKCDLTVIPMRGWTRSMRFSDTGLLWTPTSPQVPEATTPLYYATTGIIGELGLVSIGVGYTLPFKLIGAPFIHADTFAVELNSQKLPGVRFAPFHYTPYFGRYKGEECHGVLIHITDPKTYRPISTQYLLLGMLKSLYPKQISSILAKTPKNRKELFTKANGTQRVLDLLENEKFFAWKLISSCNTSFAEKRAPYLIYQ